MINCLLASSSGAVYAGTTDGLARSLDGGKTWQFTRGKFWKDRTQKQWHGVPPREDGMLPAALLEDYVTCLAEDSAGQLAIGHRSQGLEVWDTKEQVRYLPGSNGEDATATDFVSAVLAWPDSAFATGWHGNGVTLSEPPEPDVPASILVELPEKDGTPALPLPAAPPSLDQLNKMLMEVLSVPADPQEYASHVSVLADDWRTEGDWLGRYGRYWACLCACCSPSDYLWGAGWKPVDYQIGIGDNHLPGDSIRYWVEWLYSDDPRVLELPPTYLDSRLQKGFTDRRKIRRAAEVDDHGEVSWQEEDGPHLYATLSVPKGLFYLSMYHVNYDGQWGNTAQRDYRLSVRPVTHVGQISVDDFKKLPEWASGRVRDNWGGVWKRFLVRGPTTLAIEVNRNHSLNATLSAIMLDLVDEEPPPYFGTVAQWTQKVDQAELLQREEVKVEGQIKSGEPVEAEGQTDKLFVPAFTEPEAADRLIKAVEEKREENSAWWASSSRPYYCSLCQWYLARMLSGSKVAQQPTKSLHSKSLLSTTLLARRSLLRVPNVASAAEVRALGTCFYNMGLYANWETCQKRLGLTPAREIEKALRWDGISDEGQGLQVVSEYLASHPRKKNLQNVSYAQNRGKNVTQSQKIGRAF